LKAPARQTVENSAIDGGVLVDRMMSGQGNFGFDAARKDMSTWSRPVSSIRRKVVRTALENAVSVASVPLLTEATMTETLKAKREQPVEPETAM
jgi:chaperonin GroEL